MWEILLISRQDDLEKVLHSQILEKGLATYIIIRMGGRNMPVLCL